MCAIFGGREQVTLDLDVVEHPLAEGDEPLTCRCTRAEGRGTADEVLLEAPLALVEQSSHQTAAIAEMAKQRALANLRGVRHLIHRDRVGATGGDEAFGRM